MNSPDVLDALEKVRQLQAFILERNRFKGYSGKARLASAAAALVGAFVMSRDAFPRNATAHVTGWCVVLAVGVLVNYSALLYWFLFNSAAARTPGMLKPAADALPPLVVGGILATALVMHEQFDLVFGACLCLYGLAQVAYRRSLPLSIYALGFYYLGCGAYFLLADMPFTDPWPMALTFTVGEIASGIVLIHAHRKGTEAQEQT